MTHPMIRRARRRRATSSRWPRGFGWSLAPLATFGACTLLAPSDAELLGEESPRAGSGQGGASSAGSSGDSAGGESGAGIDGGTGGDGGQAGAAGSGAGAPSTCEPDDSIESCGTSCVACPAPANGAATCTAGQCGISCDLEFTSCAGACVDFENDVRHCGGCGASYACGADASCLNGRCISSSGCSDGSREALNPISEFPDIAGCDAHWPRASLRAAKTGMACGNARGPCPVPADACGVGWHVCGVPPYGPVDVSSRITSAECLAAPGSHVIAVGDQACEPCSSAGYGAACCGQNCVQQNGSCVFAGSTAWFGVIDGHRHLCSDIEAKYAGQGVLCCRD